MAYTKLFQSIVTSSIWTEDDKTRIVWITMLALADRHGEIQASIPGLARVSGVSIADTEGAIAKFLAPDPYSRTTDDEGRRIEKIEGGWALLNHAKYREMASDDDRKTKAAVRQKRFRDKESRNSNAFVTPSNATVTPESRQIPQAEAETEEKAKAEEKYTPPPTRGEAELPLVLETEEPPPPATPSPFDHFWKAYPKKKAKESAQKSWDRQKLNSKATEIIAAVETQKRTTDWTRESGRFIPHPATWLNSHRWEDDTSGNNPNIIEAIDTENIPEFNPETDVCPF